MGGKGPLEICCTSAESMLIYILSNIMTMTMTMNYNDNENTLFDHNIQIEITIYKQFR